MGIKERNLKGNLNDYLMLSYKNINKITIIL